MSGWLDFFEQRIICPECNKGFEALFCEDGDIKDPPEVETSLASGRAICPYCNCEIKDGDLIYTSEQDLK